MVTFSPLLVKPLVPPEISPPTLEMTKPRPVKVEKSPWDYHISKQLKQHWTKYNLNVMKKVNRDRVIIVDGVEGVGKSLWTMQQAYFLDKEMFKDTETFLKRVAFTPEEFFESVRGVKNGVVIFDEAFRGLSSRSALSKVNKKIVQVLMEMRQQNNIVFIVLPSFFLLDIYPAMLRSNSLFNVYYSKASGKRAWRGFNKQDKNKIYQNGIKKGWIYTVNSYFKGNFYNRFPGGEEYQQAYENRKSEALQLMDSTEKTVESSKKLTKMTDQRDAMLKSMYENTKSYKKLSELAKSGGWTVSKTEIGRLINEINGKKR